jgi:hypothetical protein
MIMDRNYVKACLDFRMDSALPESGMNYETIVKRMEEWEKPMSISGTYSMDPAEGED